MNFGQLGDYIKAHPKAAIGAAAIGGLATVYGLTRKRPKDDEEDTGTVADVRSSIHDQPLGAPETYANYPVINVQVPEFKKPAPSTQPPTKYQTLQRKGKTVKVTAGPEGICPPGYVSAQQPGQPPRCTLASDASKKKGQRTSYFPSLGQTPMFGK